LDFLKKRPKNVLFVLNLRTFCFRDYKSHFFVYEERDVHKKMGFIIAESAGYLVKHYIFFPFILFLIIRKAVALRKVAAFL